MFVTTLTKALNIKLVYFIPENVHETIENIKNSTLMAFFEQWSR